MYQTRGQSSRSTQPEGRRPKGCSLVGVDLEILHFVLHHLNRRTVIRLMHHIMANRDVMVHQDLIWGTFSDTSPRAEISKSRLPPLHPLSKSTQHNVLHILGYRECLQFMSWLMSWALQQIPKPQSHYVVCFRNLFALWQEC